MAIALSLVHFDGLSFFQLPDKLSCCFSVFSSGLYYSGFAALLTSLTYIPVNL